MKSSIGMLLAVIVVIALFAFEYWQYKDEKAYRRALNTQLLHLTERINVIDERIQVAKNEMDTLQEKSIGGLIDSANDALIQGWSAMISSVVKELERAKEGLSAQNKAPLPSDPAASANSAPRDGASQH